MKITANTVTLTRIFLMPIPGYLLYGAAGNLVAALILIILLGFTDLLDGIMARREGPSVLGGLLDPIADKIFIVMIYLPLTDIGIIPVWITACVFVREFLVTSLRTSLYLRSAPMRTSTIAKYKTAIQMAGIGYIIFFLACRNDPDGLLMWVPFLSAPAVPLGFILYNLIKGKKQGIRSWTTFVCLVLIVVIRYFLGQDLTIFISLLIICAITLISGFSYLADTWSALKGTRGSYREVLRFILNGLAVPVLYILIFSRSHTLAMTISIILIITLELSVGGLGNLLASSQQRPNFYLMTLKSLSLVFFAVVALVNPLPDFKFFGISFAGISIFLALAVIGFYTILSFWKHRNYFKKKF